MTSPGVGSPAQRLGRYHLAEPLGGGPTGEVFRAKVYGVAGFDRQFAVKRFHAEFVDDPDTAAAISAAARTYGSLEHPRIARLQEYGVTGGHTFTATELVQGVDLARLLSIGEPLGQSLSPGGAAALISQVARTVGYAHGRGICHLGLCPTNLIATPDGEVKITDFGVLPARLPENPAEDASLRARLPYLAPEQLAGEPTSAATDVFQLGAIACELFTGKQAFTGATPQDIARKILSSQPPLPELPGSLAKVLHRCLARSPFERYPDARALADAIDAAVRGAPLAGTIHDVSAAVRAAMQHMESLDDQVSGAVSFPLPAPPRPPPRRPADEPDHARPPRTTVRMPHLRPSSGSVSVPDIPTLKPPLPAPIAEIGGVSDDDKTNPVSIPGPSPSVSPTPSPLTHTLRGVGKAALRPVKMPPLESPADEPDGPADEIDEMPTRVRERDKGFVSVPGGLRRPTTSTPIATATVSKPPGDDDDAAAGEAAPASSGNGQEAGKLAGDVAGSPAGKVAENQAGAGNLAGARDEVSEPAIELVSVVEELPLPPPTPSQSQELAAAPPPMPPSSRVPETVPPDDLMAAAAPADDAPVGVGVRRREPAASNVSSPRVHVADSWEPLTPVPSDGRAVDHKARSRRPGKAASSSPRSSPHSSPHSGRDNPPDRGAPATARRGKGWKWAALAVVMAALGGGGYLAYERFVAGTAGAGAVAQADAGDDARAATAANEIENAGAAGAAGDAGAPDDASAVAVRADAGPAPVDAGPSRPVSTKLIIGSTPKRAKVYIDGSSQGKTPVTLDATSDRHRLALILPGYKLYTADIDGNGTIEATLEEVAPPDGPAGIKVRCSKKNRYYVFVDGIATGQLCPTERIGVDLGEHVVEIYDPITDSRKEFPVTVKDTRHSVRVRVD